MTEQRLEPALWLYDGALALALPALLPFFAAHPRLRGGLGQRLGLSAPEGLAATEGALWFHGSSAGDVAALLPLVQRLQPLAPVALSTWTRTGQQLATSRTRAMERISVFRAPYDLGGIVSITFARVRPRLLVLECLELWPRLVRRCARENVPVAVVNGRLSERSLARYRRARAIFGPCFASLSLVAALTEEDAARFVTAGVPRDRVTVSGSTKHAPLVHDAPQAPINGSSRRIVLGSVHDGEVLTLLPWIARLAAEVAGLQIVVAPRYPHRVAQVARRLENVGLSPVRASQLDGSATAQVVVVDEMGGLRRWYRGARVAFIGGTLIPHGGHNPVEAVAAGAPVIVGPHTDNCRREAARLRGAGVLCMAADGAQFFDHAREALLCDATASSRAAACQRVAAELGAAGDHVARLLEQLLRREGPCRPADPARGPRAASAGPCAPSALAGPGPEAPR